MDNKLKKVTRMALAVFMAAVMFCNTVSTVQAAGFKKSITKTVNLKGGKELQLFLETKTNATSITVTTSVAKKSKDLNIRTTVPADYSSKPVTLDKKHKKISMQASVESTTPVVYVTNYGRKAVKVKIKVAAKKGGSLKFKSKKITGIG